MQPQSRGSAHSPQGPPETLSALDLDTPDRGDRDQQLTTWSFRGTYILTNHLQVSVSFFLYSRVAPEPQHCFSPTASHHGEKETTTLHYKLLVQKNEQKVYASPASTFYITVSQDLVSVLIPFLSFRSLFPCRNLLHQDLL